MAGNDLFCWMRDQQLKQRKRIDLYSLYKKGLDEGRFSSVLDAARYLCHHQAPCYYISPEQATLLIGRIIDGRGISDLSPSQRRMVIQLYYEYKRYLLLHPGTRNSRVRILNEIVDKPAPEFYMTEEAVRKIIREENLKARRKAGW